MPLSTKSIIPLAVLVLVSLARPSQGWLVEGIEVDFGTCGVGQVTFDGTALMLDSGLLSGDLVTVVDDRIPYGGFQTASLSLWTHFFRPVLDVEEQQMGAFTGAGYIALTFSDATGEYELGGLIERLYVRIESSAPGESELSIYVERFFALMAELPNSGEWWPGSNYPSLVDEIVVRVPIDLSGYDWRQPTAWSGQIAERARFSYWDCPISCGDDESVSPWAVMWVANNAFDTDHNLRIDLHDFADFQACCRDPNGLLIPWECQNFDANGDGLVNVDDFGHFAAVLGWNLDCPLCQSSWPFP